MSVVAVTTLSFFASACRGTKSNPIKRKTNTTPKRLRFKIPILPFPGSLRKIFDNLRFDSMTPLVLTPTLVGSEVLDLQELERMRPMRSEREDQLHKDFVSIDVIRIVGEAVLPAQLAEFARP